MKQGLGQLEYSNGCAYDGEFDADEMDGHGVFTFDSGGLYQGQVMLLSWRSITCHISHALLLVRMSGPTICRPLL